MKYSKFNHTLIHHDRTDADNDKIENPFDDDTHMYWYAIEVWCQMLGKELSNNHYYAMSSGWFDTIDNEAKKVGIETNKLPGNLIYNGLPITSQEQKLNTADDFPCVGHLLYSDMNNIVDRVLSEEALEKLEDHDVKDALIEYKKWLTNDCIPNECDLVLYYY